MSSPTILNYHHIGDSSPSSLKYLGAEVSVIQFESYLEFLKRHYHLVPFSELWEPGTPQGAVALTFDDGFMSVYDVVLPMIERLEIPIKIFLNLDSIIHGYSWLTQVSCLADCLSETEIPAVFSRQQYVLAFWKYFQWGVTPEVVASTYADRVGNPPRRVFITGDQARLLVRHPLVEVGSHSRRHFPLHKLPPDILWQEVVRHHYDLEAFLAHPIKGFAPPFGFVSHITESVADCIAEIDSRIILAQTKVPSHFGAMQQIGRHPM